MTKKIIGMVVFAASLTGCKLIDQTSFGAAPVAPAPDQISLALRAGSGVPLVVLRNDGADSTHADSLRLAVQTAEARRSNADYDITTIVPALGTLDQQIATVERGQRDATDIMATLADLGVAPDRLHLVARTDPAVATPEIRLYVR